jgi:hypothetical protein
MKPNHHSLIDPEILTLVNDLNNYGYTTTSSCAGHISRYPKQNRKGYVTIRGKIPLTERKRIQYISDLTAFFGKHGCNVTRIINSNVDPHTIVYFDPVGKPWKEWKSVRPEGFWENYYSKRRTP